MQTKWRSYSKKLKCNVIPKSGEFMQKNLKEFSTRSNFFYKQLFYKKFFNKISSFPQLVLLQPFFYEKTIPYK